MEELAAMEQLVGTPTAPDASPALTTRCESLRHRVDSLLTSFQFGDSLNQMLCILLTDMHRFVEWLGKQQGASQADAAQWLSSLESSYTMDSQRARHHEGIPAAPRGNDVEFF
jgi:hypothetical protein